MAVSEKNVSDALIYLSCDPHPIAVAKFNLTVAENRTRETFANIYLGKTGTIDTRKALVESDPVYMEMKQQEAECVMEFERHRSRVKAAEMLLEVWRSENANIRAAERIR